MRYFEISSSGGTRRWFIGDVPWSAKKASWEFIKCRRIAKWSPQIVRGNKTRVFEDMPDTVCTTPLASEALKQFLEREAPDTAQFLPVRMEGPNVDEAHRNYWVINWLKSVDCLDKARSLNEYPPEDGGGVFKEWTVIDPSRIPADFVVGRLNMGLGGDTMSRVLIRDDLMHRIIKARFKGPQFTAVWHSNDRGAPAALWKPGGGRVERDAPDGPWPGYR